MTTIRIATCTAAKLFVAAGILLLLLAQPTIAEETLHSVTISPGITQKYTISSDSSLNEVSRVWVLFFGYDGYVQPDMIDNRIVFLGTGLLTDGRGLFLRPSNAVAVVDSPSNQHQMSADFRTGAAYLDSTSKVISEIRAKLPNAKLYFVGASNGSISATYLASRLKSDVAGIVILNGVLRDFNALKPLKLTQPILFIQQEKDVCVPDKYSADFGANYQLVMVEDIGVHYAGRCGPYSAHQFHGQEKAVIDLMYNWAEGTAVSSSLR